MPSHIVVNITWQENYWTGKPSQEDMQRAGHRYVSAGNVGSEFLNFDLERNVKDGYKLGFFQATRQPTRFSDKIGNVFFYSKGFIVGVYGQAEIGDFEMTDTPMGTPVAANVRAPVGQVWGKLFDNIRRIILRASIKHHIFKVRYVLAHDADQRFSQEAALIIARGDEGEFHTGCNLSESCS